MTLMAIQMTTRHARVMHALPSSSSLPSALTISISISTSVIQQTEISNQARMHVLDQEITLPFEHGR